MIVSLPMYDLPEVAPATEAWWRAIRGALLAEGLPAPADRTRPEGDLMAHWRRPSHEAVAPVHTPAGEDTPCM